MKTEMIYELRRPKHITPGKKYPALFVMHGMGSNEQDMLTLVKGLENSFFIFGVRGHLPHGLGFAYFPIQGYGLPHREMFDDGIKKMDDLMVELTRSYDIDPKQMYLLGFSQGAILAMTLALTLGNKVKGVVALSGYIPQFVKEEYKKSIGDELEVFISHGKYDQVLPYEWGESNVEYFSKLGVPVTFKSYPEGHTVSQENLYDFESWILDELEND